MYTLIVFSAITISAPAARSCLRIGHGSSKRNEAFSRFHANKRLQRLADKRCGFLGAGQGPCFIQECVVEIDR
jgi:hypothetical protein